MLQQTQKHKNALILEKKKKNDGNTKICLKKKVSPFLCLTGWPDPGLEQ